ncbi:hypothetical protein [Acaryochloris sp. CCMEE 5410]|uniref:hypothetical protein n=1 Tax=Acaryochloris sp. CCMEE 5410 TaxID=310037 RepID=UPI0002484E62|nr:hypothetical protein [Acaryochloris sp. CCMEE 5410]KAI9130374.1 hypothetical protein ON05_021300 [Acaryochloris sp. CCMEE 5410]
MTTSSSITPVSEETQALVNQKMANESDEIKQKAGELVDLIKKRAESELSAADQITRETYHQAISQAKATLNQTETFFQEQGNALDQSLKELNDDASRKWDTFIAELKGMGDRFDKAVNSAWAALIKES